MIIKRNFDLAALRSATKRMVEKVEAIEEKSGEEPFSGVDLEEACFEIYDIEDFIHMYEGLMNKYYSSFEEWMINDYPKKTAEVRIAQYKEYKERVKE